MTAETQNGIDQQSDQTKAETATTNTSPESKFVQDGDNLPSSSDLSNKESQSENATDVDGNDSSLADNQVDKADQNTDEEQKVTIKKTETEPTGKKKKKKKKKKKVDDPFKDYHDFRHALKQIPHYRMLAINRGERANKLKVKIEFEHSKPSQLAESRWVPETHPLQQFLQACAADALTRLVIPSLEREIRRELTEAAENHAVEVFACNLKNLLLQPPIRNKMVLAIDPGFKRGCSIAVVDRCGQLLGTSHIYVVGNQNRKSDGKKKLAALVQKHDVDVIAIGNGAGCRETEKMVSDTIAESLTGSNLKYTIVNEAGASFYSTSEIGREEFPDLNPSFRSAISIARRLQDPLSELVKISPANIGVGLYQHDVKAKHLSESLDEVVTFCVNKVGVNVNSASLSLLKHVSGLNSLTARRLVEYRSEKGPFQNRSQLKEVNGIGDSTFVQAAGFLRIHGGDSPLDESGIHPESYDLAAQVVQKVDATIDDLFPSQIKPDLCKCEKVDSASSGNGDIAQDPQVDLIADSNAAETSPAENQSNPESRSSEHGKTENEPSSEGEVTSTSVASESESESDSKSQAEQVPAADAANSNTEDVTAEAAVGPVETTSDDQVDVKSAATLAKSQSTTDPPELTAAQKIRREKREEIEKKLSRLRIQDLAKDLDQGELLVRDIVLALKRPQWDPRVKTAKPIFRSGIIKLEDLKPEMQLEGQVVNVVDFGVFVDIGLGDSSLIHVSQLSNKFIRDPHRKFAIGDVLQVWVTEVDIERRRIKLTAVPPGTKVGRKPNSRKNSRSKSGQNSRQKSGSDSRFARKDKRRSGSKESRKQRSQHSRNRTSKPVKPITDGMLKGKEPMRSFSDLAQFVTQKKDPKESDGKGKSK
ncbi:MAG: helix-hairpin-helix domain-containing protein [Planctomycetota bacterium]